MQISRFPSIAFAATVVAAVSIQPVHAQSAGGSEAEIALLKQQLRMLEEKLDKIQKQTSANAAANAKTRAEAKADAKAQAKAEARAAVASVAPVPYHKGPMMPPSGAVVSMPNNRPTICTADGQNCVAVTGRLHYDVGGYAFNPNTPETVPQRLDSGQNVRRGRIGVTGKFLSDWNFALIYDFGGSSDGFGGTAPGSLPGGGTSGIENAYLSYTGLKPFGGNMAIEGGIMDLLWTLDEAVGSNDITFMERASSQQVAVNLAAGDFRSAAGARWWNDWFWAGGYVTGPTTGQIHSGSSINPPGTSEQLGAVVRATGQLISGPGYSLHLGGNAEWLITPPRNFVSNAQAVTLSDRPELRIDPTTLISTGAIANTSSAQVYGVEAAAAYGPLYFQGEYFWFNVDRDASTGLAPFGAPSAKFQGGYAQASWAITGETRAYNKAIGAYSAIKPNDPFSLTGGGWGAWEIAARFSTMDLNDQLFTTTGIAGGRQNVVTAGLNWYVNNNIRFMLNYLHGDVSKQLSPTSAVDTGSTFDAVAMRTQIAF